MSASDAVDMTAQDIIPRLNKDTVTDLVLVSMLALPDSIPSHFHDTYTPIAAAGGQAQVVHLARLLATQMNAAKIGKGYERMEALRKVCVWLNIVWDLKVRKEKLKVEGWGGEGRGCFIIVKKGESRFIKIPKCLQNRWIEWRFVKLANLKVMCTVH